MKKQSKPLKRTATAKKTAAKKPQAKDSPFTIHRRFAAITAVATLGFLGFISLLFPAYSPVSLANNLEERRRQTTAPKLDTLSGNYSVAGEANSTSLLVKYKDGTADETRKNINEKVGGRTKRRIGQLGLDIVDVKSEKSIGELMQEFRGRSEVEYVEPNYVAKKFLTPNDTLFSKQWHLPKISAPQAWDITQGGFGPIAVIDTGIANNQSDLSGSLIEGFNYVSDSTDTNDDNGHGTHVAGIIAASSNNANGIASIGFRGAIMPVKVLDSAGSGNYGDVASGIVYATDNGAKIINLSLGGSSSSSTMTNAVNYALSRGVVVVASAGNNANNVPTYPAAIPGVIAVSASGQDDNLASFSSYGSNVYVSAPGVSIISTYLDGGYATMSGTSMAAPVVSGLIGLALSKGSTTPSTVVADLKTTSDKIGPYPYDANGWNQYFGYGRINAYKLVGIPAPAPAPAPAPEPTTEPSPTPTREKTNRGRSNRSSGSESPTVPENLEFEVDLEGTVDSYDPTRNVIVLKVRTTSKNLQLTSNNLIDLYVKPETTLNGTTDTSSISQLKPNNKLKIKAQWKDNKLSATDIIVEASPGRR